MPMLPDPQQMDLIAGQCLAMAEEGSPRPALSIVQQLMDLPDVPMHSPIHHFLLPAALLTAAQLASGGGRENLAPQLKRARERAGSIPGGFCGQCGACGAAIGVGIFCSVWLKTEPKSKSGWALGNPAHRPLPGGHCHGGGPPLLQAGRVPHPPGGPARDPGKAGAGSGGSGPHHLPASPEQRGLQA